jgi:tetratricopeptide (TPR) repeat protein
MLGLHYFGRFEMHSRCEGLTALCALIVLFASVASSEPSAQQTEERAALQLLRASHLASAGKCTEAIEVAQALSSRDAATELIVGKCAVSIEDYEIAISALDRAANIDPSLIGVNLYRGISLYHLEDFDAARDALANARTAGDDTALLDFYKGVLLLREDKGRESALAFERAAARSPERVEPVASYYAALAWQSLDENEPLNSAVERVSAYDGEGSWTSEAKKLVELQSQRHRAGQVGLQRWASLKAGFEYDSNVVLDGSATLVDVEGLGVVNFSFEGDKKDWRGVWNAMLAAELLEADDWTVGAMVAYTGNAHDDLDTFDQHYASLTGWVDNEIGPTTLGRFQATFGYGWIDGNPYQINLDLTAVGEERWGRWGTTTCRLGVNLYDFRYDEEQSDADLDQDGIDLRAGCGHELALQNFLQMTPTLYGEYQFSNYFSKGSEWGHYANRVHLGVRLALPFEVDLDVRGTYTRRDFRRKSSFPDVSSQTGDRNDDALQADVEVSKELTDFVVVSGRYQYTDNGSNVGVFDYKRHVAGAYVELKFP